MSKTMKWRGCFVSGLCLLALVACENKKTESKAVDQAASKTEAQTANPAGPIQGKAKEVLQGGGFTYVLVAAKKGDIWVAVPETKVTVGEECAVDEGQVMQNFPSKSLNRTFNEIIFTSGLAGKKAALTETHGGTATGAPAAASAAKPATTGAATTAGGGAFDAAMHKESGLSPAAATPAASNETTPGSGKAVVPFVELKIAKASGANAFSVADIFAKGTGLNGKKIKIKGQVVKFSPQIMGKNWLHLQDGTGDPLKNTHDLVITSAGKAEKGDIVTVEGVLAANKDFGGGYKYVVIVEDVTITR